MLAPASRKLASLVEEGPEIYHQETLDKFFAACDDDELPLFEFFLVSQSHGPHAPLTKPSIAGDYFLF